MDKKALVNLFESPDARYRGKPFWSWNGELEKDELIRQVDVMKKMGLGGFFMHSRAGLITEYLGEDWFELINATADAGEACGMEAWLYDEDRWPSGSAGGKVTVDPQYRMKSLVIFEMTPEKFAWSEDSYCAFVADLNGLDMYSYRELTSVDDISALTSAKAKGEWKVLEFRIIPDACSSNYNGTTYIDTMSRKATDRFIEMTHEEYKKRCGSRLGTSIKGIFTDEPHRGHAMDNKSEADGVISCSMCWTDDLFDEFEKRYGYDARAIIPELFYRLNGEKIAQIKLHYFDLANNLFIERFAAPINKWCKDNNIEFTGHVLHEDTLSNQTVPNGSLMRFYEHMGYPGIDVLSEGNRSYWVAKQLDSAARQLDKKWKLSELYGCTGWQFNFKSHKAVGDWQALFGINLRCQHLSWYTMEGESKRDYPASILHQSPWWKDYSFVESYFARFGVVMSEGEVKCDVLVLNPIESVWCQTYLGWAQWITGISEDVNKLEAEYARLFHILEDNHIDFDYGEEEMMSRMYKIEKNNDGTPVFKIGKIAYKTIVVAGMITMRPSTYKILDEFIAQGGKVVFAGGAPDYIDAIRSNKVNELSQKAVCVSFDETEIIHAVGGFVSVKNANGTAEKSIYVRVVEYPETDMTAVVLLNTDRDNSRDDISVNIKGVKAAAVEEWDMETGKRFDVSDKTLYDGGTLTIRTSLYAAGTKVFMLCGKKDNAETTALPATYSEYEINSEFDYVLDEENVCVLDFARWRWSGSGWSGELEVLKADREVRRSIGIEARGGEMLQPWYAKLHDTKKYGEIELEYEFYIDTLPKSDVVLAGERPELNAYYMNGIKLDCPDRNAFWVDNAFKRMPVPSGALKIGRNIVTVKTTFMRTTNIEALYLLGNFGVALDGHMKTVTSLLEKIGYENLKEYNMPFYTGCVSYIITKDKYKNISIGNNARVILTPKSFTGGLVKVQIEDEVNESILAWEPYEADITQAVISGKDITVTLVGTRRNTFGPLHLVPAIHGAYGPGHFVTEGEMWTDDYNLIDSSLKGIILKVQQ